MELKALSRMHAADHFQIYSDRSNMRFYDLPTFTSIKQSETLIKRCVAETRLRKRLTRGVFVDGKLVGVVNALGLRAGRRSCRLGYILNRGFQGRGLMTRALIEFMDLVRDRHGITDIFSDVLPANKSSRALLKRLKFARVGSIKVMMGERQRILLRFGHRLTGSL